MKGLLFAFFALALIGSCNAASINVEEAVPANTVWSFSVELPNADSFDDAEVRLDGSRLIAFYTYNNKVKFDEEDVDKTRLFSNTDPIGDEVYFLVSPLDEDDHKITLRVDGDTVEEKNVDFFEIYDADDKASLQEKIDNVKGSVTSLITQYNQLEERMGTALTQEDRQAIQSSIDNLQGSLNSLEASVQESDGSNEAKISALLQDIEALRNKIYGQETGSTVGTGFISLGSVSDETRNVIVLLLLAIAAVVEDAVVVIKLGRFKPEGDGAANVIHKSD